MARIPYLSALIPSDALFWLSGDQTDATSSPVVTSLRDEQDVYDMTPGAAEPVWRALETGERYVEFSGTDDPLQSASGLPSANLKHLFVVAAFDGAAFDDYNGLITQHAAAQPILIGDDGTTKFFNASLTATEYRKSGTLYAASNMQAPMNTPELVEFKYPTGFDITDLQIGKDRDQPDRLWAGPFHFAVGLARAATALELRQIRLYANLRSRLWIALEQTLDFPAPEIIFDGVDGAYSETYSRFYPLPLDFDSITHSHTYDDESKTFNQTNTLPPRRWQVEFNNISAAKAQVLDAFWENVRQIETFNFYDYRRDETYTGVRVEKYDRNHPGHQSGKNNVRFDLVKY